MGMLLRKHYVVEKTSSNEAPPTTDVGTVETPEVEETGTNPVYTEEQLSGLKAGEIKKLGAGLGYTITAVKQADCIKQFLTQQG